jgi:phosphatidylglycerophosphate synthase
MKFISPLPTEANNNYQGLKPALWFFYLYLLLVAFRSFTHMFAQDAGLNSIASIIIFPEVNNLNPNSVIYFIGSLWGSSQIVVLFISIIFLIKYKSLLSLAWLVFVLDNILRIITMTMHSLDQNYLNSTAPGGLVGTSVMLFVTLFMFFISIIERKQK